MSLKDKYLERRGLLNYQTKGMTQEEVAKKFADAGVRVDQKWFDANYKDYASGGTNAAGAVPDTSAADSKYVLPSAIPTPTSVIPSTAPASAAHTSNSLIKTSDAPASNAHVTPVWDYQTATVDMKGNPTKSIWGLQPKGFDPNGDVYFGSGLTGYLQKTAYKFLEAANTDQAKTDEAKATIDKGYAELQNTNYKEILTNAQGQDVQQLNKAVGGVLDVIKGMWGVASNLDNRQSALAIPVKATNLVVGVGIDTLQAVSTVTEQILGMDKTMRQYADEHGSNLPSGVQHFDPIKIGKDYAITDELVSTFLRNTTPLLKAYDAVRFWTSEGSVQDKINAFKTGWIENRMLYTELVKPTVQAEFTSRVKQDGANPDLIAMELQDPFVEAVGQILIDPLGIVSKFGKAKQVAEIVTETSKLGGVAEDALKVMNSAENIATDAQALAHRDELAKVVQNFTYAEKEGGLVQKVITPMEHTTFALDAQGIRTSQSKMMSNFTVWTASQIKDFGGTPGEVGDTMAAIVKLTSKDLEEVKTGISFIQESQFINHKAAFFGQQALETSATIRNLMDNMGSVENWVAKMKTATWDEQAVLVDTLLQNASKATYPSVMEMSNAAEKVTKAGGKGTAIELRMAQEYKTLVKEKPWVPVLAKFHNETSKPFAFANSIYSNAYFSRYGFVNRQVLNNNFEALQVAGLDAFVNKEGILTQAALQEDLAKFYPGGIPEVYKQKSVVDSVKTSDNIFTKLFNKSKEYKASPAAIAARIESETGMRVGYKFIRQHMNSVTEFGVGLPNLETFTKTMGISVDQAKDFQTILRSHGYSIGETQKVFDAKYIKGVEQWRELGWVPEDVQKGFQETPELQGAWDSLVKHVSDPKNTPESASKLINKIMDDVAKKASTHLDPTVTSMERASDHIEKFGATIPELYGYENLNMHVANADNVAAESWKYELKNAQATVQSKLDEMSNSVKAGKKLSSQERASMDTMKAWIDKSRLHIENVDNFKAPFDEKAKALKRELDVWLKTNKDATAFAKQVRINEWHSAVQSAHSEYYQLYNGGGAELAKNYSQIMGTDLTPFKQSLKAATDVRGAEVVLAGKDGQLYNSLPHGLVYSKVGDAAHEDNVYKLAFAYGVDSTKGDVLNNLLDYVKSNLTPEELAKVENGFTLKDIPLETAERIFAQKSGLVKADGTLYGVVNRLKNEEFKSTIVIDQAQRQADALALQDSPIYKQAQEMKKLRDQRRAEQLAAETPKLQARQAELNKVMNDITNGSVPRPPEPELQKIRDELASIDQTLNPSVAKTPVVPETIVDNTKGLLPVRQIHPGGTAGFSEAQAWSKNQEGINKALAYIDSGIKDRIGLRGPALSEEKLKAMRAMNKGIADKMAEAKLVAGRLGGKMRDYALLPYGETRNIDRALSYVLPYHFWSDRTYVKYISHLTQYGKVIADYGKIKDYMAQEYKDMPEWYKYNVKFPDFFGTNNGNPYMLNLESSIWPLQGLTGVDYNDPNKRADMFTSTLDDMGKFGTSTFAGINMAVATYYLLKGDKEIATAWGSRSFPQTQTFKDVSSLFGKPIELDPAVWAFQQGLTPTEETNTSKALAAMKVEGKYTEQQLLEAAHTHSGPAWDEAYQRAVQKHLPGQLMSGLLGASFKARTQDDINTQNFYDGLFKIRTMHDNKLMSDEQYKTEFNKLRVEHPEADILLLSRRAGVGRDAAYAYNVISRIPPGMTKDIYDAVGIDPTTAQKFFDSGGKYTGMSDTEKQNFNNAMADAGAMLEIPSNATRADWTAAKNMYKQVDDKLVQTYGKDILLKLADYYGKKTIEEQKLYLDTNKDVASALGDRTGYISNNPELYKYYGGISTIERYRTSQMYDNLDKKYPGIDAVVSGYDALGQQTNYDSKLLARAQKLYKKEHPELVKYWDDRSAGYDVIMRQVTAFGDKLDAPTVNLVPKDKQPSPLNPNQQRIADLAATAPKITFEQWKGAVGEPLTNLILDYYHNNKPLTYTITKPGGVLDKAAEKYGMKDGNALLQTILLSIPQNGQ